MYWLVGGKLFSHIGQGLFTPALRMISTQTICAVWLNRHIYQYILAISVLCTILSFVRTMSLYLYQCSLLNCYLLKVNRYAC